ncbi:IclR family transcriptional regulator [Amycolatopsis sp. EV170708-02-1]|uniref:IclR family transcriptional regulator n=1 Tax=Amycolatopsis sp. EV170708-02-1 TaxID=2919322 RepID=UPI001F0CC502|nr:IclR family transcriptional regulator [Amycolatopsis sp. EV170708-02-1]UMP06889.1 IclR family transcriptional regulator [Amycolatopsis sp. EV170708-02-1]
MSVSQEAGTGRTVAGRVFALLNAFSQDRPALRLIELAAATGMPVSTVHRIAAELVELGALKKERDGVYRIGLRLWELGSLCPAPRTLRDVSLPFMQDLYEATAENVHLAVRDGDEALYLERVWGRRSVDVVSRVGGRSPLHATGVGKVLLAHASRELQESVLAAGLKRYTPHTIVMPGLLMRSLREVRETGIARCAEELSLGTVSVAAPIFGPDRRVVAGLSVVSHTVTHSRALTVVEPALRLAALSISRELAKGYEGIGAGAEVRPIRRADR